MLHSWQQGMHRCGPAHDRRKFVFQLLAPLGCAATLPASASSAAPEARTAWGKRECSRPVVMGSDAEARSAQLASRATRLEFELSTARVINHEMSGSSYVNVGTQVTARLEIAGTEEVFTFLGPWDTDVERKVLNYQAPLAQAFMGKRVGERVEFGEVEHERTWEVLAIVPAPGI